MTTEQQANRTADLSPDPVLTAASGRAAKRLIWFLGLLYFINYLDRTNISFAGPNGMNQDLGLSQTMFGLASGVFFIGYLLLEVPSNLMLHRFGARRWIARILVTWGIVATAMASPRTRRCSSCCGSCWAWPRRASSPASSCT